MVSESKSVEDRGTAAPTQSRHISRHIYLLALTLALRGTPGLYALAADTDGIDGSEDNAGAFYDPLMWTPQSAAEARSALDGNDAWSWFAGRDALITTGPTCTNVNDFRAILVLPRS